MFKWRFASWESRGRALCDRLLRAWNSSFTGIAGARCFSALTFLWRTLRRARITFSLIPDTSKDTSAPEERIRKMHAWCVYLCRKTLCGEIRDNSSGRCYLQTAADPNRARVRSKFPSDMRGMHSKSMNTPGRFRRAFGHLRPQAIQIRSGKTASAPIFSTKIACSVQSSTGAEY